MKKHLKTIGKSIPLTTTFAAFSSLVPANIAYHTANAIGTSHNAANSLAEFTAVASAAAIAGLLVRSASRAVPNEPTPPS